MGWVRASRAIGSALAAALTLVAGTAHAQPVKLTMSHYFPPVLSLHKDFLEPWGRELSSRTGGKVTVELHTGASALGAATKQWD